MMPGSSPPASASDLAAAIRRGDEAAFETLFRTYAEGLVRFAYSYLQQHDGAHDLVAEVFANLWETRATFAPIVGARAYLFGAVRNRALNARRDQAGHQTRLSAFGSDGEIPGLGMPAQAADAQLESLDVSRKVGRALAQLPETQRIPMVLRWQQGMDVAEIAAALGVTENAVRIQLSRGMGLLRQLVPTLLE